jgi:hypothetical protein
MPMTDRQEELDKIKMKHKKQNGLFGLQTFNEQAGQFGYGSFRGICLHLKIFKNNIDKVNCSRRKKFMKKILFQD